MKNKVAFDTELNTPQILYPSRKKWIWISVILLVIALFPIANLYFGYVDDKDKIGVFVGGFSLIALSILSFYVSMPSASYLKITKTGFESSYLTFKKTFLWKDLTQFGVHVYINGDPVIGFNVKENYKDNSWFMKTSTLKIFNKLFDYSYSMPKNYNCDSIELIDHLNFLVQKFKNQKLI